MILLAFAGCPAAAATNEARLAVLGFARDGSAFAFEQFGWSNGTRYPYSELAVISASTGRPIVGASFQSTIAQEDARQESARLMSYTAAQQILVSLRIGEPGLVVARASGDPNDPVAKKFTFEVPGMGRVSVKLDGAVVKSVGCDGAGVKVRALAIRLFDAAGGHLRDLYKEKNPPAERFCPTGYGLAEARLLPRQGSAPVLALIVGMDRPGVGGSDRRYLGIVVDLARPAKADAQE
jgi:predicted secreted protein